MCKVPTPEGWTMNPEQVSAIIEYARRRKPHDGGTYTKAILKKCIKEGYIKQVGNDAYEALPKAKEFLAKAIKDGEEETARRKATAKSEAEEPKSEEAPKGERKGRAKAPEDLRKITIIAKEAPKFQAGAQRADHWKMIRTGMTVSEFLSQGGIKVSLLVFEERGLIKIG